MTSKKKLSGRWWERESTAGQDREDSGSHQGVDYCLALKQIRVKTEANKINRTVNW